MRVAGIDIGTNTILMLIAEQKYGELKIINDYHEIVRLGEGVDKTNYINDDAIARAIKVFEHYCIKLNTFGVTSVKAVATSAMRDAKNSDVVKDIIEHHLGRQIDIISGEEEAELSFLGTVEKPYKSLVIDIGGGSTEIIIGENYKISNRISLQIGAVRITEKFLHNSPPTSDQILEAKRYIEEKLKDAQLEDYTGDVYSVGGTATTIATSALDIPDFDDKIVHGSILEPEKLKEICYKYLDSDTQTIIDRYKVHPKRADLIGAGALIMQCISEIVKSPIIISAHGLRYGAVKSLL